MRKVAIWGFVVIAVALLFTGAQAQRVTLSPTVAPTAKPQQVEVTNFPTVQPVNGSVNVGNLPVDADGNVRVTGTTAPTRRTRFMKIADSVIYIGTSRSDASQIVATINVDGWTNYDIFLRTTCLVDDANGFGVAGIVYFGDSDIFQRDPVAIPAGAGCYAVNPDPDIQFHLTGNVGSGRILGPELRLGLQGTTGRDAGNISIEAWLYLTD